MASDANPAVSLTRTPAAAITEIEIDHPTVTRADVAFLLHRDLAPRDAGAQVVFQLELGGKPRLISAAALARKAGLGGRPSSAPKVFSIFYSKTKRPGPCVATTAAVAAAAELEAAQLTPAPCAGAVSGLVHYDRAGRRVLAIRPIAAGARLGRLVLPTARAIAAGDRLTLRSFAGPVSVERDVTALQSGDAGGRVFVKASAGPAFAVPLASTSGEPQ